MNQTDTEEKNTHVPLMGRVYSRATNTIVYIGEASQKDADRAKAAMTTVANFFDSIPKMPADIVNPEDITAGQVIIGQLLKYLPEHPPLNVPWDDINKFFEATWFERVWCVQEIVLARSSGDSSYVMYGQAQIPYHVTLKTTWCFAISAMLNPRFCQGFIPPSKIAACIQFSDIQSNENYLLQTLDFFRDHVATNPRDKVYGLLGILHQRFGFDASTIGVDYAKPVTEIYTDAASEILYMDQNLSLLEHIAYPIDHAIDSIRQSWVPRWDYAQDVSFSFKTKRKFRESLTDSSSDSSDTASVYRISGDNLLVHGFQYSHVKWTSSPLFPAKKDTEGADQMPGFRATFSECWRRSQRNRSTCFDNRDELLSMARTFSTAREIPMWKDQHVDEFLADFLDFVHHNIEQCSSSCLGPAKDSKYVVRADGSKRTGSRERYARIFDMGCRRRRFFQTELGTYGVGPDCMREGDVVVALIGGSTPYVLRPTPKGYLCLGVGYIYGLMDGKYFKNLIENGAEKEQFTLI